jgi:hypothetical protein
MTCHKGPERLLRFAGCGLAGILAAVGCGDSGKSATSPDAKPRDAGSVSSPEVGPEVRADTAPQVPMLTVSPATLAFGDVDINQVSPPRSVTVTNTGALVALNPSAAGVGFTVSTHTCASPAASCTISVTFSPTTAGAASGTLTVAAGITVTLSGNGRTPGSFSATSAGLPATVPVNQSVPLSVTVTATAAVTGLTCATSGASLTVDPVAANTTCTGTMAANATCVYGFIFRSTTGGVKSESIVCSVAGVSRTVAVSTTVVTPAALAITPNPGSFTAPVGSTSVVITFNVANSGGSPSGSLATTLGGTDANQFIITDNKCVVPLAALGICPIQVVFSPTSAGNKTATITVTDSTPGSLPTTTVLNGIPIAGPVATITGATSLGSVAVGKSGTATTYTVTNPGTAAIGPLSLSTSDPEFVIGSNLCAGQTLAASKTCTFTITFSPTSVGEKSAVVSASSGGNVLGSLQIGGNGTTAPALGMTPLTLDLGTVGVGAVSAPQTFSVKNNGGSATGALTVTNTGVGGASQFTFTTTCQAALAPGATCDVVVTFKPTVAGSASATFSVGDGTVATPARTVVGTALDRPGLGIACVPSTFADTIVGQTSAPVVCTVTNAANSAQATGALTTTPTGDFAVPTNNCAASLAAGMSCTMSVVFKPTVAGARTGTIAVTGANGGTANQNLSGNGLGAIEIQEFTAPATGTAPVAVIGGNYDFGSVSTGATSDTTLILAVYVRGAVGNLSVANGFGAAPANFAQVAGAVSLTWPGTSIITSVPACAATTTTAPTPNATVPYCTVKVSFTPQSKGAKTGTVTATGADGVTTSTATFKGLAAGPISIDPPQVTFAAVAPGSASPATILQVCNNAATQATAGQFTITGANAADFTVTLDQVSNATIAAKDCVSLAISLQVPASETATSLTATLTVSATVAGTTESATAALAGATAGGPSLQATAGTAFADTPITATSIPVNVTVSNTGGLGSGALTFSLPAGSEFAMTRAGQDRGTCASTCTSAIACTAGALAAGDSCTLRLWFSPTPVLGVGGRTDTLRVSGASGSLTVLPLSANALSQFTATPDPIDLGPSGAAGVGAPIKTVTIRNVGGADATLGVTFQDFGTQTGDGVGVFALNPATPDCQGILAAGDTCTIGVQMVHTSAVLGPFATTLLATNASNGQRAAVVVTGTAAQAILQFTPATDMDRDFGTEPMGNTSAAITYRVTNIGDLTSGPITWGLYDSPVATPPGAQHAQTLDFTITGGATACSSGTTTLAPGQGCNIVLAFSPTACSPVVTGCTGPTLPSLTEVLIVTANPGIAASGLRRTIKAATSTTLYIADSSTPAKKGVHDFGTTPATEPLTLNYVGTGTFTVPATALTFTDLLLAGSTPPVASEFAVVQTNTAGTCLFAHTGTGTGVATLDATHPSCTFNVAWDPGVTPAVGTRAVKLTVDDASMVLYGRVASPAKLVANPSSLNFGDVSQGDNSPTLSVTVTNIGESQMAGNIGRVIPAGVDYISGCNGAGLAAGASCTIVLGVQPAATGPGTGDVVVRSSTATTTQLVSIPVSWNGTNTNPAVINITPATPATVNFGTMPVLATSSPITLTLTNPANGLPTGPLSVTVDSPDFAVDAGTCGDLAHADGLSPSPALDSCTVTVTFTPRTLGTGTATTKTGTLTVKAPHAATVTKGLTGTAIAALSVSDNAVATAAEDPLVNGGCTFTDATATATALCAYGNRPVTTSTTTAFRSETITFQNAAGSPTTGVLVADLTQTDAGQYKIVNDTCTGSTLGGGVTCKVTVRFSPSSAGLKNTASLVVRGNPGDSVTVRLSGTGT